MTKINLTVKSENKMLFEIVLNVTYFLQVQGSRFRVQRLFKSENSRSSEDLMAESIAHRAKGREH
jgi:hypothetical protein